MENPHHYREDLVSTVMSGWLEQHDVLFIDVYLHKSGGSGSQYFIDSLSDWEAVLRDTKAIADPRNLVWTITVFENAFPLRGILDDSLIKTAEREYPNGRGVAIIQPDIYPEAPLYVGSGDTWEEIMNDLEDHYDNGGEKGPSVVIGVEPEFDGDWRGSAAPGRLVVRSCPDYLNR